jgi:hypothetical protein
LRFVARLLLLEPLGRGGEEPPDVRVFLYDELLLEVVQVHEVRRRLRYEIRAVRH